MKKASSYLLKRTIVLCVLYTLAPSVLFLVLTACSSMQTGNIDRPETAIFWKISAQGTEPSYLFGTIHSEDPRVTHLEPEVKNIFEKTDLLVIEVIPDEAALKLANQLMFLSHETSLSALLPPTLYSKSISELGKRGIAPDQANMMKPWAITTLLSTPEPETGLFLDMKLLQLARQQQKTLMSLETMQEQINVFDQLTLAMQIEILAATIKNIDNNPLLLEQTIDAWLSKDLARIEHIGGDFFKDLPTATAKKLEQELVTNRNLKMADRLGETLTSGNAFIAVGALHLPGKQGLIQLLRGRGYTLEPISTRE